MNVHKDLTEERDSAFTTEDCPHCQPHTDEEFSRQTKTCMQNETVAESVRVLQEHVQADSGGLPAGQARGKIILPCGTGKTRISLRSSKSWHSLVNWRLSCARLSPWSPSSGVSTCNIPYSHQGACRLL